MMIVESTRTAPKSGLTSQKQRPAQFTKPEGQEIVDQVAFVHRDECLPDSSLFIQQNPPRGRPGNQRDQVKDHSQKKYFGLDLLHRQLQTLHIDDF